MAASAGMEAWAGPLVWPPRAGASRRLMWLDRFLAAALAGSRDEHSPMEAGRSTSGVPDAANAEGAAFGDFFVRYHFALLDYLYGMTRDRELAADLAQDTFVRAYAAAPDLARIAKPRAWLYRIATNVALNAARHRRHFEWLPLSQVEPEDGAESAVGPPPPRPELPRPDFTASVAERDAIWTVLAELPPRWRAVLLLQTTAGFEVGEIATLLGLSAANVRKILFRAKERFRAVHARLAAKEGRT